MYDRALVTQRSEKQKSGSNSDLLGGDSSVCPQLSEYTANGPWLPAIFNQAKVPRVPEYLAWRRWNLLGFALTSFRERLTLWVNLFRAC